MNINYWTLSIQNLVGFITLIGTAAVVFTVIFLLITAGKSDENHTAKEKVYRFRRKYFWGLFAILSIAFFTSLTYLPFENKNGEVNETYTVLAFQWGWKIAPGEYIGDWRDFKGKNKLDIALGDNVQFDVTSRDVTHGLGIYDENGVLLSQTQAIPGSKNKLYFKFNKTGIYKILCMEFCGNAHANMVATIHVKTQDEIEALKAEELRKAAEKEEAKRIAAEKEKAEQAMNEEKIADSLAIAEQKSSQE